jgi:hypothetical protein
MLQKEFFIVFRGEKYNKRAEKHIREYHFSLRL